MIRRGTGTRGAMVAVAAAGLLAVLPAGCGGGYVYRPIPPEEIVVARHFTWLRDSLPPFRLYVSADAPAAGRIPELGADLEASLERIAFVLGRSPGVSRPIHVFQVATRDEVETLTGLRVNGLAMPETGVVVGIEVSGWSAASSPHEIMHVFQYRHFGGGGIGRTYGSLFLNEGMAVFAGGRWQGKDLHAAARRLLSENRGVALERMLAEGRRAVDDGALYPLAGSFVRFLHERYGPRSLYDYYRSQFRSDTCRLEAVYGRTAAELEAEWRAAVGAG